MIKLTLAEVVEAIGGRTAAPLPMATVECISTDTRTLSRGDLFFALDGERFDGHAFVTDALQQGALGAVVGAGRAAALWQQLGRPEDKALPPLLIEVDSPRAALGRLAAYHRRLCGAPLIAVVGSNGKTTTKAMIHHILSARMVGRCSPKSFNNEIGVPLTLLSAEAADEYMVVEIGTSGPGEIDQLARLAQPDMVVLTSLGEEHLEGLGDLAGVAAEECSIFEHLSEGAFAAVNMEAPQVRLHLPRAGVALTTFGRVEDADVRLTEVQYEAPWLHFTLNGRFRYRMPIAGAHNALNATGAITIARRLGFSHEEIAARLESLALPPMRNEILEFDGLTVINDAYNANPHSVIAALDMLDTVTCRGRRAVVLGEMRELGRHAPELHRRVAERLARRRVDLVYLIGAAANWMAEALEPARTAGTTVVAYANVEACLARLPFDLQAGDVVLLKASRAVGLERLVEPMREKMQKEKGKRKNADALTTQPLLLLALACCSGLVWHLALISASAFALAWGLAFVAAPPFFFHSSFSLLHFP